MNTPSCSSNDVGTIEASLPNKSQPPSIFEALHGVAYSSGCRINLTDHRGRRFLKNFYVANTPAIGRCGVWGFSTSGASQLVAWPRGRCRGPSGNRVGSGWGNPKSAQKMADQLNQAAAAWLAQYGPVPRSKPNPKKKSR